MNHRHPVATPARPDTRHRAGAARSRRRRVLLAALVVSFGCASKAARADCFDSAASYHGVNPLILRAIAAVESHGNPQAIHRNRNGTTDIGELQINSTHLRELAAFGIRAQDLLNECVNVYVAAWHLKKQVNAYGNTWDAVGAYHSRNPRLRDEYARLVKATLVKWGVVASDAGSQ
jgi:soluble lytic murein transglycosylase-like protein